MEEPEEQVKKKRKKKSMKGVQPILQMFFEGRRTNFSQPWEKINNKKNAPSYTHTYTVTHMYARTNSDINYTHTHTHVCTHQRRLSQLLSSSLSNFLKFIFLFVSPLSFSKMQKLNLYLFC